MSTKERIKLYLDYKGITIYRFEKDFDLYKNWWVKTVNIPSELLSLLPVKYIDLSASWLLTGEGSMLKSDNRLLSTETPIATEQSESKISREMEIIASQQQTIERLTKIIENLTLK